MKSRGRGTKQALQIANLYFDDALRSQTRFYESSTSAGGNEKDIDAPNRRKIFKDL